MTTVPQIPITRQAPLLLRPEEACVKCGRLTRFCDRQGLCPGCQGRALEREQGLDAPAKSDLEEAIAAIDAAQAAGMVEWADIILVWRDKSGARGAQPFTSAFSIAETCIAAAAWLRERHHKPEVQAMDRDACEAELEAAMTAGNIGAWGKVHHGGGGWNAWTSPGITHDADSELAALRTVVAALREHKHGGAE